MLHEDETLTNNKDIDYCDQCQNCKNWGNKKDDPWTNKYDKCYCDMFSKPIMKPQGVINNTEICKLWQRRGD